MVELVLVILLVNVVVLVVLVVLVLVVVIAVTVVLPYHRRPGGAFVDELTGQTHPGFSPYKTGRS